MSPAARRLAGWSAGSPGSPPACARCSDASDCATNRRCRRRGRASPLQLEFFPSRTVTWYMARLFAVRIFAVLAMLVLVLQMLDLLGESGKILAGAGNGEGQLWMYVGLRAPQLAARFLPYS